MAWQILLMSPALILVRLTEHSHLSSQRGQGRDGQTFPDQCTPRLSKFPLHGVVSTFGRISVQTESPCQRIEMKVT